MKASIIIPTKNPGAILQRVIQSVFSQAADFEYELLVIDSGSTDGTLEFLQSIEDSRIRIHCIEAASFGHGRTRNLGISMTTGEYAVLLTHDAVPANEDWLSSLVSVADSDKRIAGVFGRHKAYAGSNPLTSHEIDSHFAGFNINPIVEITDSERFEHDLPYRQFKHFFSDNNALLRRSVWAEIPYRNVDFAEDQLWAIDILKAGYKKAYAVNAVVFHSHEYTIFERLQRSFDESSAFKTYFGYNLAPSFFRSIKTWLALTRRDLVFFSTSISSSNHWKYALLCPFDNLARLTGYYLGARSALLPKSLCLKLSRDKSLMNGTLRRHNGSI